MEDNMLKNGYDSTELHNILQNTNYWIRAVDTKTGILMAFIALVIGFNGVIAKNIKCIFNTINIIVLQVVTGILFVVYIILAFLSIIFCFLVLCSRISLKNALKKDGIDFKSNIFYGDIQSKLYKDYIKDCTEQNEESIIRDMQTQIYINSCIATKKHKWFNIALITAFIFFIVGVLLMILSSVM